MPALSIEEIKDYSFADLERLRSDLTVKIKAAGIDDCDEDLLRSLAAVTGTLRRKSSGPPKEPKVSKKKTPASLDDLA
jgi:hypothetical protein